MCLWQLIEERNKPNGTQWRVVFESTEIASVKEQNGRTNTLRSERKVFIVRPNVTDPEPRRNGGAVGSGIVPRVWTSTMRRADQDFREKTERSKSRHLFFRGLSRLDVRVSSKILCSIRRWFQEWDGHHSTTIESFGNFHLRAYPRRKMT